MRVMIVALALVLSSGSAFASPLNCWYDSDGNSQGADSGDKGYPVGQVSTTSDGLVFVIADGEWDNGNSCPESVTPPQ